MLLRPQSLSHGDTICIVSPAGSVEREYVESAVDRLSAEGFRIVIAPHALGREGRYSGTVAQRLADLREAFTDPSVKAILCARGGYGVVHLLEQLDDGLVAQHPKWMIGYSDISAIHALMQRSGIVSLHAPMVRHIGEAPLDDPSYHSLLHLLRGGRMEYTFPPHSLNRRGTASGTLRGGNLALIQSLRGTPYDFNPSETVLFIEDVGERPYQIERMLYNLRLGNVFDQLKGLIVGSFTDYDTDPTLPSVEEMIARVVEPYDFPVCYGFPVGHTIENYPMCCGGSIELRVESDCIVCTER